jgi:hypothetical protein
MVMMSRTRGSPTSSRGWSVSREAASAGRAAFLAPLALTVPASRLGPCIRTEADLHHQWSPHLHPIKLTEQTLQNSVGIGGRKQRRCRLEACDLGRELAGLVGTDIGRVADHQVETGWIQSTSQIGGDQPHTILDTQTTGVGSGDGQRRR